ncbi:MAG: Gfo/Idh/MocA family oxidoreductase, partial [Pseudomonadota bacterium]|nr:Gfo/Idh/MocA family oxidoreductase [Pseudomonadota bacterium]
MSAMNKPIRWGILGTGLIAAEFAKAMHHVRDAELLSVGSRTRSSARDFANAHGIAHAHASYEALAEDPNVDVVYIATPHTLHFENTLLCLQAGKHVLCEKPFALNTAQVTDMVIAAREHKLFLMEAMWMRFIPLIRDLVRRLAENEIGEVKMLQADFGFRAPLDPSSRLFNLDLGGGALLDIGIYPLAFATLLLGEPEEITSVAHKTTTGVDEQSAYLLRHSQGQISVLASALRTQTSMSASVYGSHGHILLPKQFWRAKE